MSDAPITWSLLTAQARMAAGTCTASEYAEALLAHALALEPTLHAYAHLDPAYVRREAARADLTHATARGVLHGIPVGVKDIIGTADLPTRCGSTVAPDPRLATDATVVERLRAAGGYVFGKTVTTEFAFYTPGSTTNPHNAAHTPGGSSSGSAAAVASGSVPVAIGTQTNGSVIRPAAYCGIVGFRPTRDALPYTGISLFSPTLDTAGVFARNVADATRLASVLAERGRVAPATVPREKPPRIALLPRFPWTTIQPEMEARLDAVASRLRLAGAEIVAVSLPDALNAAPDIHKTIVLHEGASNLEAVQRRARAQLSARLNDALDAGRAIDGDAYRAALASRRVMIAAALDWMQHYDAVLSPAAPGAAPAGLGSTGDPACCTLWSLLDAPAIALPMGRDGAGLPLGMQLASTPDADDALLNVAAWIEAKLAPRTPRPGAAE
ncbi:MAG: amidase [Proteobacteria bacterium]|nr:amidase [Pseudomonadota bacterium]